MEYCDNCKKLTRFKEIRRFKIPNGNKIWVACEECNAIKLRIVYDS